ncbi:MAG: amidohydrolase family protein [Acidobacteria bacterium]|nr:amidohydrolase family protein [Acidobacteriota bacterium]
MLTGVVARTWVAGQARPVPDAAHLTIDEYTPRSTLVVAEHAVPRAKYPVIDVHSHHRTPIDPAGLDRIAREMDALNLRVLVNLSGGSGETLKRGLAAIARSGHADRMVLFANLDFSGGVGPGFGRRAAAALEEDIKAGAKGLKVFKNFGLRVRSTDGHRLAVDDPELDAVWDTCARLNVPVLIHTGEPAPFFEPVDKFNERFLELTIHPERRVAAGEYPTFNALMAERDRLFARHQRTRFVAAHMAWSANDLGRLGGLLDRLPNVFVETGAVLAELGRQPLAARAFFEKYQDRILFGKDTYAPSEYPYYWRTFETRDEYFDYYRHYHAFWKLYGMNLPVLVLKKLYYKNALRLVAGLSASAFPE